MHYDTFFQSSGTNMYHFTNLAIFRQKSSPLSSIFSWKWGSGRLSEFYSCLWCKFSRGYIHLHFNTSTFNMSKIWILLMGHLKFDLLSPGASGVIGFYNFLILENHIKGQAYFFLVRAILSKKANWGVRLGRNAQIKI